VEATPRERSTLRFTLFPRAGSRVWLRRVAALHILLTAAGLYQYTEVALTLGVIPSSWKWSLALAAALFLGVVAIILLITGGQGRFEPLGAALGAWAERLRPVSGLSFVVFAATLLALPAMLLGPVGIYLEGLAVRIYLLWSLALISAILLRWHDPRLAWSNLLVLTVLAHALVYRLALFLPAISSYPFSLGYSEGSRYYYASLFFGERIYRTADIALPVLHPSRYMLQSIPFLFAGVPLWGHRLWQVLLWAGMPLVGATALARRFAIPSKLLLILWTLWITLFLYQGPVYYHLLPAVALILWGTSVQKPVQTMIVVVLASVWAGLSRFNWIPVPGMLAATLYLLETPQAGQTFVRTIRRPALWVIAGTMSAAGAAYLYRGLAQNPEDWLSSIQNSPLLVYRLLPSATYKIGVLPAIAIASLPLLILVGTHLAGKGASGSFLRGAAVAGILATLLGGGLLVSTKIGGGDDLHNLDAFLVHLLVVGLYVLFDRAQPIRAGESVSTRPPWTLGAAILTIPVLFTLGLGRPTIAPDPVRAAAALDELHKTLEQEVEADSRILLISQRHLLTFEYIQVPLEQKHEKTFLMEMAMSNNQPYFDQFRAELASGVYDWILVDPQYIVQHGRGYEFGEEDDAWTEHVTLALLEYYETERTLDLGSGRLAFMRPKENTQ
jgi:hypothetical protein